MNSVGGTKTTALLLVSVMQYRRFRTCDRYEYRSSLTSHGFLSLEGPAYQQFSLHMLVFCNKTELYQVVDTPGWVLLAFLPSDASCTYSFGVRYPPQWYGGILPSLSDLAELYV